MSVHKTWRDVAAHWAAWIYERLNGWCNERPWFEKRAPEYLADSARLMKCPDLGTAPDKLMESLKSDVKFYRWTDSHVIQPLNSVDYKSKEATAEVVRICERINRLHDRLLDGGKADDLLVEVPMEPSNRSQQLASAMSYLVRKDTLDERSQATDMVRKHTGLELPHSDDLSDSELIELASSFPGVVVGRNVDWEELKGWALNHGLSPQAARDLRPKEMLGWWRAHQSKGVTAEVKPMKKDKGERIFTVEELRKETQTRPPGWTQKMWASAQRFPELSPADRAIVLDRYHEIAGPSVPAVPDDAGADWWWATDNHRPEALLQAMQEADFIKKTPVEAVAVSNAAPQAAILIDEAYFEFCGQTLLASIRNLPNVFVGRTFSTLGRCFCGWRSTGIIRQPITSIIA